MAPKSTIIITGGTGSLGSAIALSLETSYPDKFHLILTCRNTTDERAVSVGDFLQLHKGSFELKRLDLSDLEEVKVFAERIKARIATAEIPGLVGGGIVNSAAYMTFVKNVKTKDGIDVMYTINSLAPALLVRTLLPALMGTNGLGNAVVVNVGSEAHAIGHVGYFEEQKERNKTVKEGEKLGFPEGMKRYGSTKLLSVIMGYAFQRQLYVTYPSNKIHLYTLDPGSMNSGGRLLGDEHHWVFPILYGILNVLGPVVRPFKKEVINAAEVPAKAIADLFGNPRDTDETWKKGKYYVLDDEKMSSKLSLDENMQDEVWKSVCKDLSLEESVH